MIPLIKFIKFFKKHQFNLLIRQSTKVYLIQYFSVLPYHMWCSFMKQYTIKSFADLLVSSRQFESYNTREKKLLLLDRCNWYISFIVKENILKDKPYGTFVNLNSKLLKKYLGSRNYKEIQNCLVGLGIIVENNKYSTAKFSKSFCLTKKAIKLGVVETPIYSKKFNVKIKSRQQLSFGDINSNPILKKIIDNTLKLVIIEEPAYYVLGILPDPEYREIDNHLVDISPPVNQFKMDRYESYYNSFYALNEIDDPKELFDSPVFYPPNISSSGRIYHTVASMPKLIRESMRVKPNKLIWEVDMCSAQPSIIFLEWLSYAKENQLKGIEEEIDLCLKLVLEGNIYSYIKDNSQFFGGLAYKELKVNVLSVLNAENKPTKPNKELSRLFPNVMKWVNSIKMKYGYKQMSFIGQSTEAKIFVEVYKELPSQIFALIIHDCILVIKKDVTTVKQLLEKRIRQLYSNIILPEHNLKELFKASLVSISDDKLLKNQWVKSISRSINREV